MIYPKGKRLLDIVFKKEYFNGYRRKLKFYNHYLLPFLLLFFGLCFTLYRQRDNIDSASAFLFTNILFLGLSSFLFFKLFQEKRAGKKLEAELNAQTSRLDNIYNSGIMGLIYTRFDGLITQANDRFLDMIGYDRSDLEQGKISWVDITPPEFAERSEAALEELRTKGFCEPFEKEYIRKDGSRVIVMLGSSLLLRGDNAQLITYAIDISGLKDAQRKEHLVNLQVQHHRNELFRILKKAPVAVVIREGPDLEIDYANQLALDYTCFGHQAVSGTTTDDLHAKLKSSYFSDALKEVYRTGKTVNGKAKPIAFDRDGTGILTQGWFDYVCEPVFDVTGKVNGVVTLTFEVTDLVRANLELKKNEHRFRFITDAIPHKMWTAAADGLVNYYNKGWSDYLQETELEKLKIKVWEAIHPEELEEVKRIWQQALENGTDMEMEQRLRRHDGVYEWHLTRICSCRDDGGGVTMYVGTSTNIHEQKMAQIAVNISMAKKDEFLDIAAHELRTPITSMKTALQSLERSVQAGLEIGKTIPLVSMANKQVKKLTSIVDDLVEVDKIQSGKLQLNKTVYLLSDSVKEVIANIKLQEPGHTLKVETQDDAIVNADKIRVESVLTNLLTNAIKYSHRKETVLITIEKTRQGVKCSIKDSGIGIPTDLQQYVFDRFFRAHGSSQFFSGLGLGLYISAEIIRRHEGEIGFDSQDGKGSTFWFILPAA